MQREASGCCSPHRHFPVTQSSWSGDARSMEAIGIIRLSSIWKVGCVRPCSGISTPLPASCMAEQSQGKESDDAAHPNDGEREQPDVPIGASLARSSLSVRFAFGQSTTRCMSTQQKAIYG